MITVKLFYSLDHIEIGELGVFLIISLSPFYFASLSSKYRANLAAIDVTLTTCAIKTTGQILTNYTGCV